jgi:hypothetical protein
MPEELKIDGLIEFDKGIFCLSFHFELAWGSFDVRPVEEVKQKARLTRERVLPKLFELMETYKISATWATVGHLMLESCDGNHGQHLPHHAWFPNWYLYDPKTNEKSDPEWYAYSQVKRLRELEPRQDIGLHTFSHSIMIDEGCDSKVAEQEMINAFSAAKALGIQPYSFVYTRRPGTRHAEILSRFGIIAFTSYGVFWYSRLPGTAQRPLHMLSQFFAVTPKTVTPSIVSGMVNLPATLDYLSMDSFRRFIPVRSRVYAAQKGIRKAGNEKKILHLSTHPINLAYADSRTPRLLEGFEKIFAYAANLRDRNILEVLNMRQIAERVLQL